MDIDKASRGPQIIISRAHKGLLEKLFEMEVPEIYDKIVRIEASAREPGARSKIAVSSRDRDVDPVGACVGMKGSRVQAVVQELRGEKIDIVPYDPDPVKFVCNAIAPAEVSRVLMDVGRTRCSSSSPTTSCRSPSARRGRTCASPRSSRAGASTSTPRPRCASSRRGRAPRWPPWRAWAPKSADALFKAGFRSATELSRAGADELAQFVGSAEAAARLLEAAGRAAEIEEKRRAEERERARLGEPQREQATDRPRSRRPSGPGAPPRPMKNERERV
jgi:N utilization substance protein A